MNQKIQKIESLPFSDNPEYDLLIKLSNYLSLFSFLLRNECTIKVVQKLDGSEKEMRIGVGRLVQEYSFEKFNRTNIQMQKKLKPTSNDKYLVLMSSLVACFVPSISPNLTLNQLASSVKSFDEHNRLENIFELKNTSTNSSVNLFMRPELQPVIYVSGILGLFTIIFSIILLFSYHYNKQDAELADSKIFIKQWTQSYFTKKRKSRKWSSASKRSFSAFDTIVNQPARITFAMNKKKSLSSYFKRSQNSLKVSHKMKSSSVRTFQPVSIVLQEDTPQSGLDIHFSPTKNVKFDLNKRISFDLASIKTC